MVRLLYEDAELVAVDKPSWAVVHRARGAAGAVVLAEVLARQVGGPVFPVHRLDRQTSGVMVFARTSSAASVLAGDVREGRWRKRYLGLCRGVVGEAREVDHPVADGERRLPARTDFDPLEAFCGRYTLVRAFPRSGRRHQVRYHLKHIAHPLIGDANYGQGAINRFFKETFGLSRMFLHAEALRIVHPRRAEHLSFEAPMPAELEEVLARLRIYEGPVL
ncbi:MAG: pseudouridylate synthase [Deltaproteobacteria bacterium]|nr:pseudouridylate synthase [Deltaproteobacteria bacterium]